MASAQTAAPTSQKPLRLWPGVALVVLQWLVRFVGPVVAPEAVPWAVQGAFLGGVLIVLWWLFFSRAPWLERLGAVALMVLALVATPYVLHETMAKAGMGWMFYIYAVPVLSLALVVWAAISRRLATGPRWAAMAAAIFLACGMWALVRTGGVDGTFDWDFAWRWSETAEERFLARAGDEPAASPAMDLASPALEEAEWPGFRGPGRDGVVRGVRIATDWSASPPVELWRRPVGPGWSSFAVHGDLVYTQEQRGEEEVVSCYAAATGEPVWVHGDPVRFWEPMAGAGPRSTPAISDGRVYALGATGILNALDAADGSVVWSRDTAPDVEAKLPIWAFAGSPLVVGDEVVIALSGQLAAYDLATGEPRWVGPAGGEGYGSPHLATLDGVEQVLLLNGKGAVSVSPADGAQLWESSWEGFHSLQPALTADGDVLFGTSGSSGGYGTRRLVVTHGSGGWTVEERWTSTGLKPYFNDFVVHQGHAYGFDNSILACIDLEDGERCWKGGRYGNGQLVLVADQDVLLVLSEKGELALVSATPEKFTELARFPAIEGKTWNHPVLVGDLLLVRNAEEMAAFRLGRNT
jgi:outer membrane protein assembly factor BamB